VLNESGKDLLCIVSLNTFEDRLDLGVIKRLADESYKLSLTGLLVLVCLFLCLFWRQFLTIENVSSTQGEYFRDNSLHQIVILAVVRKSVDKEELDNMVQCGVCKVKRVCKTKGYYKVKGP
jgi:hypothetical protein